MRNASGHQCKVKMSDNEKKGTKNTYDSSSKKRVTKTFLEVSRCSRANNGKEMYKKVCCTSKVASLLIIPIVVFPRCSALPSPLNITRFYILFEQTLNIIESSTFSPG